MPTKRKAPLGRTCTGGNPAIPQNAAQQSASNKDECKLMTVQEAAEFTKVSEKTLSRMIKSGTLPYYPFGDAIRINRADICALKAQNPKKECPEEN